MAAADVDRMGYGDCKALSNYTMALLGAVGVPAYYTRLYGSEEKRDVVPDFVAMQSNHVILAIPHNNDYVYLECTSQTDPFGYHGVFTDDRNVLIMKPEGAEIARTKEYADTQNQQISKGKIIVSTTGDIEGSIELKSHGSQYNDKYRLESLNQSDRDRYYNRFWSAINNLKVSNLSFQNDKKQIVFTEKATIRAIEYGKFSGKRMIIPVNAFNRLTKAPPKIRDRKMPFEISRGYLDTDEIEIALPSGFSIEALPLKIQIDSKFGNYFAEVVKKDDTVLLYNRRLLIKTGSYSSADYENYRLFIEQIIKNDNSKLVLVNNL